MSTTTDQTQRMIFLALPFVFVTFVIHFPAGLLVYWITTNMWTIVQQAIIRKRLGPLRPPTRRGRVATEPVRRLGAASAAAGQPSRRRRQRAEGAARKEHASRRDRAAASRRAGRARPPPAPPRKKKKRSGRRR